MTPAEITSTRKRLDLTQVEFAALIGISASYVTQLERGHKSPDGATARILSIVGRYDVANALAETAGWSRRWA